MQIESDKGRLTTKFANLLYIEDTGHFNKTFH